MEAAFERDVRTPEEVVIKTLIDDYKTKRAMAIEQEMLAQRKRLVEAEAQLLEKPTQGACESQRDLDISDFKRETGPSKPRSKRVAQE